MRKQRYVIVLETAVLCFITGTVAYGFYQSLKINFGPGAFITGFLLLSFIPGWVIFIKESYRYWVNPLNY